METFQSSICARYTICGNAIHFKVETVENIPFFVHIYRDEYKSQYSDAIVYVSVSWRILFSHYIAIQINTVILFALTFCLIPRHALSSHGNTHYASER